MNRVTHMVDDSGLRYCSTWSRVPGPNTQDADKVTCPGCKMKLDKSGNGSR